MFGKLITHEDPYFIHKAPGIYCLCNFLYQQLYYVFNKSMNLSTIILLPHFFLHISSFMFNVLPFRTFNNRSNMFIWNELRIHSMIFSYRSCLILIYPYLAKQIVFLTLISADITTSFYGSKNVSTVRGNHKKMSNSQSKQLLSLYYSVSQIGATLICSGCFQYNINSSLVFSTLPAIQTSAFGLTLLRKNIINKETWGIVYSLELFIVYLIWYSEYGNVDIFFMSLFIYLLRTFHISKYIIWSHIFILDYYLKNYSNLILY